MLFGAPVNGRLHCVAFWKVHIGSLFLVCTNIFSERGLELTWDVHSTVAYAWFLTGCFKIWRGQILKKSLGGGGGAGGGGPKTLFSFLKTKITYFTRRGRGILVHYRPFWPASNKKKKKKTHKGGVWSPVTPPANAPVIPYRGIMTFDYYDDVFKNVKLPVFC